MADLARPNPFQWIVLGAAGGGAVGLGELVSLPVGVWPVAFTLVVALGTLVGGVIALLERATAQLPPGAAALVRATGALPPLFLLGAHLFDGARAQTMAGASLAPLWVPIFGWAAVAWAIWWGGRLPRIATTAALLTGAGAAEAMNRAFARSGYPELHLVLGIAVVTMIVVAMGLHLRPRGGLVVGGVVAAAFVSALIWGLDAKDARQAVAVRGVHTRHLTRIVREIVDLDGDGWSAALGGPDCDDTDPRVNPRAVDVPGNAADEDCDGFVPAAAPPRRVSRDQAFEEFAASAGVHASIEHLSRAHVLLVSIDSLRADQVADTAENRRDFPNIFALLDEARVFRHAFSPAAGTDVSIPGLMTGRLDPFTTVETTLAEAMVATGRQTHAVIPSEVLRWVGRYLITRGFESWNKLINEEGDDVGSYTTSEKTTELALRFLRRRDAARPFFLWVHYFDAHEHHQVDPDDGALRQVAGDGRLGPRRKYRALVTLVDRELGRLVAELRASGVWDDTIVVLTSDHGESLGEDPRLPDRHGLLVYNPLVHIPLAVRVPGVERGVVAQAVSLVDVAPTLTALASAGELPEADGSPLLPFLFPGAPPELVDEPRPLVMNESDQHGVVVWPWKVLARPEENLVELYDLSTDFGERRDLAEARPDKVRELLEIYRQFPSPTIDRSQEGRRSREEAGRRPPAR